MLSNILLFSTNGFSEKDVSALLYSISVIKEALMSPDEEEGKWLFFRTTPEIGGDGRKVERK